MLHTYDPVAYDSLPTYVEAAEFSGRCRDDILCLGELFLKFKFEDALATCLLHKHFDILPQERLVRRFISDREAIASPQIATAEAAFTPWIWRYTYGSSGFGWYPTEFVVLKSDKRGLLSFFSQADGFLDEMSGILQERRIERYFGFAALYASEELQISEDDQIVERSFEEERLLTLEVSPKGVQSNRDGIQTLWDWSRSPSAEEENGT